MGGFYCVIATEWGNRVRVCRKYVSLAEELGGFMRNKKAGQLVTSYR